MHRSRNCVALVMFILAPPVIQAATIVVTSTTDSVNAADGVTSLREAFIIASSNGSADDIVLGAGQTYALTNCVAGPLQHTEASPLSIAGNAATINQTCNGARVIDNALPMAALKTLIVDGVTLTGAPNAGMGRRHSHTRAGDNYEFDLQRAE